MKKLLSILALGAVLAVPATAAWAASHIYNDLEFTVTVYWEAAGCAGVKSPPACGGGRGDQLTVCKSTKLGPGESDSYSYASGDSGRKVWAIGCEGDQVVHSNANTSDGGNKKNCAVTEISDDLRINCGYNDDDYETLKGN